MNIFYVDRDPHVCAQMHCDKHVVKMVLEYGQLLSTAHRLLDGASLELALSKNTFIFGEEPVVKTRKKKFLVLPHEQLTIRTDRAAIMGYDTSSEVCIGYEDCDYIESDLPHYHASHQMHPSGIWARSTAGNYAWLFRLFNSLLDEYTHRYGKIHSAARLKEVLQLRPRNIPPGPAFDPPQCMPEHYKERDAVLGYQNYYVGDKTRFARWTNRQPPQWFQERIENYVESNFVRAPRVVASPSTGGGEMHHEVEESLILVGGGVSPGP